jgi:hypothetical protein
MVKIPSMKISIFTVYFKLSWRRYQENHSSKAAWANSLRDPISKNPITKNWVGGVSQGEGPEFKPQ